jgi:hypothetical protein
MTLFQAGVVAGQDLTSEAALTKLAYLLALPNATPESVSRDMSISLRGELTLHSQTAFRHPDGVISEQARILTALGYAIANGDLDQVKEVTKGEHQWVLNDTDYSGNTPVVRKTRSYFSFSLFFFSFLFFFFFFFFLSSFPSPPFRPFSPFFNLFAKVYPLRKTPQKKSPIF